MNYSMVSNEEKAIYRQNLIDLTKSENPFFHVYTFNVCSIFCVTFWMLIGSDLCLVLDGSKFCCSELRADFLVRSSFVSPESSSSSVISGSICFLFGTNRGVSNDIKI